MADFDAADLPDVAAWRSAYNPPPDTTAFLARHLSIASATLFAELMVPKFVLVENCVILAIRYQPENFAAWWRSACGNVAAIEGALNLLHLWDIFDPECGVEMQALEHLARLIARSWLYSARQQFPDRQFVAEVTDDYGPTVTLRSRADGQAGSSQV